MAKILIADDDPQILQVLTGILKGAGHTLLSAVDGKAAFELFQKEKPQVVIADVLMPSIAGTGLSARIKREADWCGVLLISGVYTDPAFPAEALGKYKADAFLLKPFTPQQVLSAIAPLVKQALEKAPAGAPAPAPAAGAAVATVPSDGPVLGTSEPKKTKAEVAEDAAKAAAAVAAAMRAAGLGKSGPNPAAPSAAPSANPPSGAAPAARSNPPSGASAAAPSGASAAAPAAAAAAVAPPIPGSSVPAEGNLERLSVLSLLYRASNEKLAGKFTFKKDVATKEVWVRDGKVAHATSNLETDRLDYKLMQEGKINGEQYKDLGTLSSGPGGTEGALIALKLIPPGEVFEASRGAGIALVLEVFKWLAGKFQFQPGLPPPAGPGLDVNIEELIQRGLREAFDLDRLQKAFGGRLKSPVSKDLVGIQNVEKLKLTPAEFRLSRMIDGKKTVDAIAKEWAGGDAPKELRALQVLYLMSEAGMVRLEETVEAKKAVVNLDELKKKLADLEKQTLFEVLGITKEASPAAAKQMYFNLAKKYHPDTIPVDATVEHRKLIEAIFSIIGRANQVLGDPKQREAYLADLEVGGTGASLEAENVLTAEFEFQKGEFFLLKKKDVVQAEKHLATALKLNPREAEHQILWGWLLYVKSKGAGVTEALKYIEAGMKIRKDVPNAYLFMGHIYKAKSEIEKAEKYYRMCVSLDDKNTEAMSELRVIAMRKGKR